jgi:hypothetical protein
MTDPSQNINSKSSRPETAAILSPSNTTSTLHQLQRPPNCMTDGSCCCAPDRRCPSFRLYINFSTTPTPQKYAPCTPVLRPVEQQPPTLLQHHLSPWYPMSSKTSEIQNKMANQPVFTLESDQIRNLPSNVICNCSIFNHFKYGIHHFLLSWMLLSSVLPTFVLCTIVN